MKVGGAVKDHRLIITYSENVSPLGADILPGIKYLPAFGKKLRSDNKVRIGVMS